MSGKLTVAPAEVPSPKLAVSVKPAPLPNTVGFRSDSDTKNAPPAAPETALLAVGCRTRPVARSHRRRGPDHEGHRELGGLPLRRPPPRDAGAEPGARPRLEVRAGHRDSEARSLNPAARRHAGDR